MTEKKSCDVKEQEAVERLREVVITTSGCLFCTASGTGNSSGVRPMGVRQVDDSGCLWFLSANDSHKDQEIEANPLVSLYFQGSEHSDFLHLEGRATV